LLQHPEPVREAFDRRFKAEQQLIARDEFQIFVTSTMAQIKRDLLPRAPGGSRIVINHAHWVMQIASSFDQLGQKRVLSEMFVRPAAPLSSPSGRGASSEQNDSKSCQQSWGDEAELAAMLSSPAETAALRQLLTVTQEAQCAGGGALDPFLLLRFLRARQGSVEEAAQMYFDMRSWRQQNNIGELLEWECPNMRQVCQAYQMGCHRTDRYGNPLNFELVGRVDFEKTLKLIDAEKFKKWYFQQVEVTARYRMPSCSRVAGRTVYQATTVMDLKEISTSILFDSQGRKVLQSIIEDCNNNYPEQMYKMFIINCPSIFPMFWRIIKNFVDKNTRAKIHILGKDFLGELTKVVAPENIPDFLGGSCRCPGGCLNRQPGPWDNEHQIPPHLDIAHHLRDSPRSSGKCQSAAPIELVAAPAEEIDTSPQIDEFPKWCRPKTNKRLVSGVLQMRHARRIALPHNVAAAR